MNYRVRHAERTDCDPIATLIRDLARYEGMEDQAKLTASDLERDAFDTKPAPYFHCAVAEVQADDSANWQLVGFALYFYSYSTWEGKMLYLEDFYVDPAHRGAGLGARLLRFLARIAVDGGFARLKLECLEWNTKAIGFYKQHGAVDMTGLDGWHSFRFEKEVLTTLAAAHE